MLYFYCSMALRENVLMVNGSNIRPWWIHHHYWSIFTCFLFLTIPIDSPGGVLKGWWDVRGVLCVGGGWMCVEGSEGCV